MNEIAQFFWDLRSGAAAPGTIPSEMVPVSLADAYHAQSLLVRRMTSAGGDGSCAPIGYKVACTSEIARQLFRVEDPVFGRLLSCRSWRTGTALPAAALQIVALEPEFSFRMATDPPERPSPWTGGSIAEFVGDMMPAIELVGNCFSDWSAYCGMTLAADNAVNRGWVCGTATSSWRGLDLSSHPVKLRVNGNHQSTGSGANVMGNPLNAIAWLANTLPEHGLRLQAQDVVTTGVCTDIYPVDSDACAEADFGELGKVRVSFTR